MDERIERINKGLGNCGLGKPLLMLDSTGSTNDVLKQKAEEGAAEGCTVIAGEQTGGRGRMGRQWLSLKGKGLYMSILLRPPEWPVSESPVISMFSALAVAGALKKAGLKNVSLKWPNDVLAGGRKISGILIEPETRAGIMKYCVIGIGVNVAHSVSELGLVESGNATSCAAEGVPIDRDELAVLILKGLDKCRLRALPGDRNWIIREWAEWINPNKRS